MISEIVHWYRSYLTNWILTFYALHYIEFLNYPFFLSLLVTTGFTGGFYITYIKPKQICFPFFTPFQIKGTFLKILDFIFHFLPFLHVHMDLIPNQKVVFRKTELIGYLFIILLYISHHDIRTMYTIHYLDCFWIGLSILIINQVLVYSQYYYWVDCK